MILYYDSQTGIAFNSWVNEHDVSHATGCVPLIVIDVFEHGFLPDYGTDKLSYINSFLKVLDWKTVEEKLPL